MEAQKVTVFAPKSTTVPGFQSLPKLQQEINAINRYHDATVYGEVVRLDLLRATTEADRPDILHFAGHLTETGFVGSKEIIPISTIIMAIETGEPKLAVFNVCTSQDVAEQIASRCPTDCVFTLSDVEDTRAVEFSIAFYAVLRRDEVTDFRQACKIVDPDDQVFRYIAGRHKPRLAATQSKEKTRMDELAKQIATLNQLLADFRFTFSQSLYELRADLKMEVSALKERSALQQQLIDAMNRHSEASDRYSAAQLKYVPPTELTISQETLLRVGVGVLVVSAIIIFVMWFLLWRGS